MQIFIAGKTHQNVPRRNKTDIYSVTLWYTFDCTSTLKSSMQTTLLRTRSMRRMTHNAILDKNSSISMGAVCCQTSDSSSRFISNELLVTIFNSADLATRGVSVNELNENPLW